MIFRHNYLIIKTLPRNYLKCFIFAFLRAGEVLFENSRVFEKNFVSSLLIVSHIFLPPPWGFCPPITGGTEGGKDH